MKRSDYILKSLTNALGTLLYISLIALLGFYSQSFDNAPTFLAPMFVLLLFVISACVTGLLVLGKPINLYLNGLKKEAFIFLFATLGWLVVFLAIVVILLLVY